MNQDKQQNLNLLKGMETRLATVVAEVRILEKTLINERKKKFL